MFHRLLQKQHHLDEKLVKVTCPKSKGHRLNSKGIGDNYNSRHNYIQSILPPFPFPTTEVNSQSIISQYILVQSVMTVLYSDQTFRGFSINRWNKL